MMNRAKLLVTALLLALATSLIACDFHVNLIGNTPEEVAQYAVKYAQGDSSTPPQVLLSRRITIADFPALGLGCHSFASIEEPPLVLVILKGNINPKIPSMGGGADYRKELYVAYVFDLWANSPMLISSSTDSSDFRRALDNQTLPTPIGGDEVPVCPTAPAKTMHYGDTAPIPSPPALPSEPYAVP